ncbi:MAG: hypothetical protein SGILL_001928 [Bacillariaceae sp.]
MADDIGISASDWAKGIALSILASLVGGASKLAIRKSWLLQEENTRSDDEGSANNDLLEGEEETGRRRQNVADNDDALSFQDEQLDELGSSSCHSTFCSPTTWFLCLRYSGMFGMSVLNPICCVLAMNYASPSILAPFSGLTLCWVILGSNLVNNEQPSRQQILASSLIIAGEVIVAIFGDHTNDEGVTVEDVQQSYKEPAFILYFVGLSLYVAVLAYWIKFSNSAVLRRCGWGCCGGAITGAQNFLKDSLTILKDVTQQQQPGELPWCFYVFLACAAGTAFTGLLILTACMKRYDATYSAASFVGSFVVSASIMAAAHYNTFAELEGVINYVLYPLGLAVLMIGVYLLVRDSSDDEDDGQDRVGVAESENNEESEVRMKLFLRSFAV